MAVVQLALTSLDADIAATRSVIARQKGRVVRVGHSYGGVVASVATQDRILHPDLARFMYERSGATVVELATSHVPHLVHPQAVADVIVTAAGEPTLPEKAASDG